MDIIQQNDKVLFLWDQSFDPSTINTEELKQNKNVAINFENVKRLSLATYLDSSFNIIISRTQKETTIEFLASLLKLLKPQGRLVLSVQNPTEAAENAKLAGFVKTTIKENEIVSEKPNYEIGSAAKLSFAKKSIAAVWKISNDDEDDTIDADELLDEEDKAKPDPATLRVCGTTGKRKACKDCSCGLADELAAGKNAESNETQKSSCGSCYLGDAFRCATCPYLGMPAFKPGEKVQLAGGLLKEDI